MLRSRPSRVRLFVTPRTVAHQAPLSIGILQQGTGVGGHALLQGIFPTQGSNPGLLHCRQILYHLSHQGRNAFMLFMLFMFFFNAFMLFSPVTSTVNATRSQTCISQTLPSFWSPDWYLFPAAHFIWPVGMPFVGWRVQGRYPLENVYPAYLSLNSAL